MPPAISEDESSGSEVPDDIPAKAAPMGKGKAKVVEPPADEPEAASGDDAADSDAGDDVDEDEYVVEKILDHAFARKKLTYQVKWLGYDNPEDITWEPIENLESAPDKLKEYHASIGGPPTQGSSSTKQKKGIKRSASDALDSPAPTSGRKRGRKSETNGHADDKPLVLPTGTWENDISSVMSIIEEMAMDGKKEKLQLMAYVEWNNRRKSKHTLATLRTKAPQHLLTYYENHLKFGA